jgi:hypothetical protein
MKTALFSLILMALDEVRYRVRTEAPDSPVDFSVADDPLNSTFWGLQGRKLPV